MVGLFRGAPNSGNHAAPYGGGAPPSSAPYAAPGYGAPEPVAAPPQGYGSNTTGYSASGPGYDADYASQGYSTAPVDNRSSYPPAQSYSQPEVYPSYNKPAGNLFYFFLL